MILSSAKETVWWLVQLRRCCIQYHVVIEVDFGFLKFEITVLVVLEDEHAALGLVFFDWGHVDELFLHQVGWVAPLLLRLTVAYRRHVFFVRFVVEFAFTDDEAGLALRLHLTIVITLWNNRRWQFFQKRRSVVVLLSKNRHDFFCLPPHHSLGDDVRQDDGLAVGLCWDFFGLYIGRLLHTHLTILHRRYSCLNLLGIYTKISNTTSVQLIVLFYQFFEILDYIPWLLVLKTLFFCILHLNAAFAISLNKVGVELAWRLDDLLTIFLGVIFTDAVTWCLLDVI